MSRYSDLVAKHKDGVANSFYGEMSQLACDLEKAAEYYKAGMLKLEPKWVPARVMVLKEQYGDHPFRGAGVAAGEHDCQCNRNGAVSVLDRAGKPLGLRLDEFEPVAWREQETAAVAA